MAVFSIGCDLLISPDLMSLHRAQPRAPDRLLRRAMDTLLLHGRRLVQGLSKMHTRRTKSARCDHRARGAYSPNTQDKIA
eukprot:3623268-Pleurochrysis_carterae.AAC.2